jgi:hypothetical protein
MYEVAMAELFIDILDKLCAHCHTNEDYRKGCRECPAGNLAFECRDYVLNAIEEDKHHELYLSKEWIKRKEEMGHPRPTEEELTKERYFVQEYKPECEVLRAMKKKIKGITPHPFFYVRHHKKYPYERPKRLSDFVELTEKYKKLRNDRLRKWGLLK